MYESNSTVLFDTIKQLKVQGEYKGSIITKCLDPEDSIIFSDNIKITEENGIRIKEGLKVGFDLDYNKKKAFSKKQDFYWEDFTSSLEYSVKIPDEIMQTYSEGQFSDAFPFTLNLLHTAGLYLNDYKFGINHLDFFAGEILKNPVTLILHGILIADRVVINDDGDPVFYDCLIVGRDENEELNVSYEPITNVDDVLLKYIIILGIEELKL